MKIVNKPWGREEWIELNEFYCYKRIYLNAGTRTSLQFHEKKVETNYIISGNAEIWLEDERGVIQKTIMGPGDFFNVKPPQKHRVVALTDVILQEVSTPEVDDVIRISDDTNRPNGKIEMEHQNLSVLILCAGIGSRMKSISKNTSKILLPINDKAVISHIIEKFPIEYEIVIALGYKGNLIEEYCNLAHSERNIRYVYVDDYESAMSGPGYSALCCKEYLQKPFYLITGDTIIEDKIPSLGNNWMGVSPTDFPEKYSTAKVVNNKIVDFKNKSPDGFQHAFTGIAGIVEYEIFWNELEKNIKQGEIVSAFENINSFNSFEAKNLIWFDTGNVDDFLKTTTYFNKNPLSLIKDNGDCVYKVNGKLIKFFSNQKKLENLKVRAEIIKNLIPKNIIFEKNFLSYDWVLGKNLYDISDENIFENFLSFFEEQIEMTKDPARDDALIFYSEKTQKRIEKFLKKYGNDYYSNEYNINGVNIPSMKSILEKIDMSVLFENPSLNNFHGDLQFANIIYDDFSKKFTYIDWRDSFGKNLEVGDIYYDLAKLLGGMLIPYDKMKDEDNFFTYENKNEFYYSYELTNYLKNTRKIYEKWLKEKNYDYNKILLVVGLIFLNMSPLHEEKFSKMLWFKSMEMLNDYNKRN